MSTLFIRQFVFVLWDLNLAIWKEIICLLSFLQLTIFLLDYIQSTRSGSRIKRKLIRHRCRRSKEFDLNIWWDLNITIFCLFKEQILWHRLCDMLTTATKFQFLAISYLSFILLLESPCRFVWLVVYICYFGDVYLLFWGCVFVILGGCVFVIWDCILDGVSNF